MKDSDTMRTERSLATASWLCRAVFASVTVLMIGCGGPSESARSTRVGTGEQLKAGTADERPSTAGEETSVVDSGPDDQPSDGNAASAETSNTDTKPATRQVTKNASAATDETPVSITEEDPQPRPASDRQVSANDAAAPSRSEANNPTEAVPATTSVAEMTDPSPTAGSAKQESAEDSAGRASYPDAYFELPAWNREGPQGATRVSFDDFDLLKIMGLDPVPADVGPDLPERIQRLDGMRVRLRGFMYPPYATEGLRGFVLARDNEICCFGRSPKIYDLVPVELSPGVTTRYIEGRPFDVVGVLHVAPEADDDELYQLFYMDDAIVIE